MKRKALLIGNTGGLQGVKADIAMMSGFLSSRTGGFWLASEIDTVLNPSKAALAQRLQQMKTASLDYVVLLFSGHGGHERQTLLELNPDGETIEESHVIGLAPRQVSIFDCCRVVTQEMRKAAMESAHVTFDHIDTTRQRFESRIMQAIPQQARLYGCSVNECSYDTSDGALYLNNLLAAAKSLTSDFKTVEMAHADAREKTIATVRANSAGYRHGPQTPEAVLPKCLTSQQLVLSIRP